MTTKEFVSSLRAIADWYEEHPDVKLPYVDKLNIFTQTRGEFIEQARLFGKSKKSADDMFYELRKEFGAIVLALNAYREKVCERILVGTKVIPAHIVPAQPETVVPESIEEQYEWKCPEALLANEPPEAVLANEPPGRKDSLDKG